MDMFRRLPAVYDGPIMLQNAATYAPLTGEQIAALVEEVPAIEYIKEERPPGPRHIAEVRRLVGDRVKTIFGGFGGRVLPDELQPGRRRLHAGLRARRRARHGDGTLVGRR